MIASDSDGDSEEMRWIKIDVTTANGGGYSDNSKLAIGTSDRSWKTPTTEKLRRGFALSKPIQGP